VNCAPQDIQIESLGILAGGVIGIAQIVEADQLAKASKQKANG
jgi:hypothetical protein